MNLPLVFERKIFFCTLAFILNLFALALLPCRSAHHMIVLSNSRRLSAKMVRKARVSATPAKEWPHR